VLPKILMSICVAQETHRLYKQKLEEVSKLQDSCSSSIVRQRKKLKDLSESLEELVIIKSYFSLKRLLLLTCTIYSNFFLS